MKIRSGHGILIYSAGQGLKIIAQDKTVFNQRLAFFFSYFSAKGGRLGAAKVSCILCYRGVQLILSYSWARPAILVAGKGRGGMFLLLLFLDFHYGSSSFSFISSTISSISFLSFSGRRHKMTHKGWCVVKPQHNQSPQKHRYSLEVPYFKALLMNTHSKQIEVPGLNPAQVGIPLMTVWPSTSVQRVFHYRPNIVLVWFK